MTMRLYCVADSALHLQTSGGATRQRDYTNSYQWGIKKCTRRKRTKSPNAISISHVHAGRIFTSSNSPPTSSFLIVPEAVDPCDEAAIVGLLKLTGTSPSKSSRRLDSICTRGVVPIIAPPGVRRHACCAGLGEMLQNSPKLNCDVPGVIAVSYTHLTLPTIYSV